MSLIIRHRIPAGLTHSTILPDMDFETYSEAGYDYNLTTRKWVPQMANKKNGLEIVGAAAYSEHPSTRVLCLAYDLKDGYGERLWSPMCLDGGPQPLFDHIAAGELIEAWNCLFEFFIWTNVCTARMGWPMLPLSQLRDAMAKARAWSLPGKLEKAGPAAGATTLKIEDGKRLLGKFSKPRHPTKKDDRLRILPKYTPDAPVERAATVLDAFNLVCLEPDKDYEDTQLLHEYCIGDIKAEAAVSALAPDLSDYETQVWLMDQRINTRGVGVDVASVINCQAVIDQALAYAVVELKHITGGKVDAPTKIKSMGVWLKSRGTLTESLNKEAIKELLARPLLPPDVRRVIEIRAELGAASVKKLAAIYRSVSSDGRLRDLFGYCGASRTGRWAGYGAQPQNLPNSGPKTYHCSCGHHFGLHRPDCPWCGLTAEGTPAVKWNLGALEDALSIAEAQSLEVFEYFFDSAVETISGCLRGLFRAGPGKELICSDFSAIEAVVLAALAGEEWRLEVFRTHGMIYEKSAADITGVPFDEILQHKIDTGEDHPLRKEVGKVAELAGGFGGGVAAWKRFGADKYFDSDEEIQGAITAWREASPEIVAYWKRLEKAAVAAVQNPGTWFDPCDMDLGWYNTVSPIMPRGQSYCMVGDVLYGRLLSGRTLSYHSPRVMPATTPWGSPTEELSYMGWDSVISKWVRTSTFGGKLCENKTQAEAREIFANGMMNLDRAGYWIVLHTHDEPAAEVPIGFGSIEEFEALMCKLPDCYKGWPIKAAGGWRGPRYHNH